MIEIDNPPIKQKEIATQNNPETGKKIKIDLKGIKAGAFDLDGFFAKDSMDVVHESFKEVFKEFYKNTGVELTDEDLKRAQLGGKNDKLSWPTIASIKFGKMQMPDATIEKLTKMRVDCSLKILEKNPPKEVEGANETIRKLKEMGLKLAIVSGSPRGVVEAELKSMGIDSFFDAVITGGDVKNPKPNAEPFEIAANLLGVKPEEMIAGGDTQNDVISAHRAGIKEVIGVLTTFKNEKEFHQAVKKQKGPTDPEGKLIIAHDFKHFEFTK